MALITPKAHAPRLQVREQHRGEDVDRRDQEGGANPLQDGVAKNQNAEAGRQRTEQRSDAVDDETEPEARFPSEPVRQLATRDHQRCHHEKEECDADLHTLDGRVQINADAVDHDVHVRSGEAADELGQGERDEHRSQRGSGGLVSGRLSHRIQTQRALGACATK